MKSKTVLSLLFASMVPAMAFAAATFDDDLPDTQEEDEFVGRVQQLGQKTVYLYGSGGLMAQKNREGGPYGYAFGTGFDWSRHLGAGLVVVSYPRKMGDLRPARPTLLGGEFFYRPRFEKVDGLIFGAKLGFVAFDSVANPSITLKTAYEQTLHRELWGFFELALQNTHVRVGGNALTAMVGISFRRDVFAD
jgi:hypothetical protein